MDLNRRRPQTFNEWRQILRDTHHAIGVIMMLRMAKKSGKPHPFDDAEYQSRWDASRKDPILTKDLWKLCSQAYRIDRHLMAEIQSGTSGAMRAMMEMLQIDPNDPTAESP